MKLLRTRKLAAICKNRHGSISLFEICTYLFPAIRPALNFDFDQKQGALQAVALFIFTFTELNRIGLYSSMFASFTGLPERMQVPDSVI